MFKKKYNSCEMKERIDILWKELVVQCQKAECFEFEYHWEMWGAMWYPWFLTIKGKPTSFTANDIGSDDFEYLINLGFIELIKKYDPEEVNEDEYDKEKYRVIKTTANKV